MSRLLEGRVAIVTGAGRGIGRAHALELAAHGAKVVVNDYGVSLAGQRDQGEGAGESPAEEVAALIAERGGEAVTNGADVADFGAAEAMVRQAIDTFGGLDILVNNAGFVRDRMLVNTSEEEWDAVIRVHLKGHFAPLRHAGAYWRAEAKAGRSRAARVINTSSGAGLQGSVGQATYSAAKAGIAGLTLVAAQEMGRYGVTVNAIAPVARTRMTEGAFPEMMTSPGGPAGGFDAMDPANNSPIVAWLASEDAGDVTGRVIEIEGGQITVENCWSHGPAHDLGARWPAADVGQALRSLIAQAPAPESVYGA
ncbi:MAG: SDR family oxidoreductase [Nocardioides sp.]